MGTGAKPLDAKVLLIHNFDELEQRKDEVRGKIVFYNYPFNPLFIGAFEAYSDAVRYRGAGASRAAKYGAVGVIVRSMSEIPSTMCRTYGSDELCGFAAEDPGGGRGVAGCGPAGNLVGRACRP